MSSTFEEYKKYTYDMFMFNMTKDLEEVDQFSDWVDALNAHDKYSFEGSQDGPQGPRIHVTRQTQERFELTNFASYNYLGLGHHPQVIQAAKAALDQYGLGAASSPVVGGTNDLHKQLEGALVNFFGLPDRGVSLFSSGYAVNSGTIQAFMKPGGRILIDRSAHMSILEGAQLSRAEISYFDHNDVASVEKLLEEHCDDWTRVLVCLEGIYSADGDAGNLRDIVALAKKYGAFTLVDEAHSVLVAGATGRGVCEQHGVLDDVDLYVMTFSKAFGGVGGALLARRPIARYVNWYAKSRMFSCALDPAVTGGLIVALDLAAGAEGVLRRQRIQQNTEFLHRALAGKVSVGTSSSWIVPVNYGAEARTLDLNDHLQRRGLATSLLQFPAVPKNEARIRLFVTSEHTREQLQQAADVIIEASEMFGFSVSEAA